MSRTSGVQSFPNDSLDFYCLHCLAPCSALSLLVGDHTNHPRTTIPSAVYTAVSHFTREFEELHTCIELLCQDDVDAKLSSQAARDERLLRISNIDEMIADLQKQRDALAQEHVLESEWFERAREQRVAKQRQLIDATTWFCQAVDVMIEMQDTHQKEEERLHHNDGEDSFYRQTTTDDDAEKESQSAKKDSKFQRNKKSEFLPSSFDSTRAELLEMKDQMVAQRRQLRQWEMSSLSSSSSSPSFAPAAAAVPRASPYERSSSDRATAFNHSHAAQQPAAVSSMRTFSPPRTASRATAEGAPSSAPPPRSSPLRRQQATSPSAFARPTSTSGSKNEIFVAAHAAHAAHRGTLDRSYLLMHAVGQGRTPSPTLRSSNHRLYAVPPASLHHLAKKSKNVSVESENSDQDSRSGKQQQQKKDAAEATARAEVQLSSDMARNFPIHNDLTPNTKEMLDALLWDLEERRKMRVSNSTITRASGRTTSSSPSKKMKKKPTSHDDGESKKQKGGHHNESKKKQTKAQRQKKVVAETTEASETSTWNISTATDIPVARSIWNANQQQHGGDDGSSYSEESSSD